MNLKKGIMKNTCVYFIILALAFSMCFLIVGCDKQSAIEVQSDPSTSDLPTDKSTDDALNIITNSTKDSRSKAHYALYYANKELRTLTYLDEEYNELNKTYDKAARAWYKGQYHMDLVTCGEISQKDEVTKYLETAQIYFSEAITDANTVSQALNG